MAQLVILPSHERTQWFAPIEIADRLCFPDDDPYPLEGAYWWVELEEGAVVAYAALKHTYTGGYFLARAGVLPAFRGKGLQTKLIRCRTRYAKRLGGDTVFTYTAPENVASARNLAKGGFLPYTPAWEWAGKCGPEANYWHKEVK